MTEKTLYAHFKKYQEAEKAEKAARAEKEKEKAVIIAALNAEGKDEKTIKGITAKNAFIRSAAFNVARFKTDAPEVYAAYLVPKEYYKFSCK